MPKESLNIYLTAVDGMSPVLASITDKTKALDKESQQLEQTYEALQQANSGLIERKTALQKQLHQVNEEVKEARKQFKELGNEASSDAYEKAQEKQQKLRDEIAATTKALQENQKTYKENIEIIRKGEMEEQSTGLSDIAKGLFAGQIGQMFSSSLGGLGETLLTSALGTPTASLISDTLSSAISGGAAGAMFGPWGIAAGAALGGLSGMISGSTKIYEEQDSAFKEYYNGLIDTYGGLNAGNTESGSAIASGWEDDLRVFSVLLDDDAEAARGFQDSLIDLGRTPPFSYDTVSALSKDMLGLGLSTDEALDRINALAEAAAALDWSESNVSSVISYLESAQLAGTMDSRVVKSLSKMGVNVYGALADEFGISEGDVMDQLSDPDVDRAVDAIYAYLGEHFAGASAGLVDTYSGASGILESYQTDIAAAAGESYNGLRTEGIQAEIDSLGGALGDAMKEINSIIGENQARGENLKEEYQREALSAVLLGESGGLFTEEQQAALNEMREFYEYWSEQYAAGNEEAGLHMQSLYEQAQMLGEAYYESSEWAQEEIDVQLEQIEAIRDNTAGLAAATDSFRLAQESSKGLAVAIRNKLSQIDTSYGSNGWYDDGGTYHYAESELDSASGWYDDGGNFHPYAYGLDRVPYNDYPALLHEGERVLTAREARAMDAEDSLTGGLAQLAITITGNNFSGGAEDMADQIAEILVRKLEQAAIIHQPR